MRDELSDVAMEISVARENGQTSGAPCRQRDTRVAILDAGMLAAASTAVNAPRHTAADATEVR
jgi:hypothetical protein